MMDTPENETGDRGVAPAFHAKRRDKNKPRRRPSQAARHPAVTIGSGIFTFLLFALLGGGLALWYGEHAYNGEGPLTAEKTVLIPRGSGVRDMAEMLEREGVIDNWLVFVLGQRMMRPDASMKAGEYLFKPGQSMASVVDAIASGKVLVHQVTIPEGLTSQQVVQRLMANDMLTGTPTVPLEGTLLPETYRIHRGMSREELLKQMADAQQKLVKTLWEKRAPDLPVKNPQEMIILASIVEKETGEPDERPKVAAVFINRLTRRCGCSRTRPSFTGWWAARVRWGGRSPVPISCRPRPTTPMQSTACLRGRLRIPGARRSPQSRIRPRPRTCISWRTAPAGMRSPRRWPITIRMLPAGVPSRRKVARRRAVRRLQRLPRRPSRLPTERRPNRRRRAATPAA